MISKFRKRISYTNVAVTLALLFAMSGGAYAASHYVITSTKQIKPSVLKTLKGQNGKNGASGSNGATGPTGAAGAQGPQGPQGTPGEKGPQGIQGIQGKEGKPGIPGETGFTETLPSNKTETGTWSAAPTGLLKLAIAPISFSIPLAAALSGEHCSKKEEPCHVHYIKNEEPTTECPGSVETPTALPGNLCVYDQQEAGATAETFRIVPSNNNLSGLPQPGQEGAGTSGALAVVELTSEIGWVFGSWAVTAP